MGYSRLAAVYGIVLALIAAAVAALLILTAPRGTHLTTAELMTESSQGYQAAPAFVAPGGPPGDWTRVTLPNAAIPALKAVPAIADSASLATQVTWYRLRVEPARQRSSDDTLYIPRWKSDGTLAIYVNGRLAYQSHGNLQWNGSHKPLGIRLADVQGAEPVAEILLRLQHVRGIGGAMSSLWLGRFDEVGPAYYARNFLQSDLTYLASVVFLANGLFALGIWLRRREERPYLLFFLVACVTFVRSMHTYMGSERMLLSDAWFGWLTVNALAWTILVGQVFIAEVHQRPARLLTRLTAAWALVLALATCPLLPGSLDATLAAPVVYLSAFVFANLVGAIGTWQSWQAASRQGMALALVLLGSTWFGVWDILLQNNLVDIESYFVVPYGEIVVIVAFTHAVGARYLGAMRAAERANLVLSERLAAREADLATSYARLREIEARELIHTERQRLMEDMHDGVGSSLLGALRLVEAGRRDDIDIALILKTCIDDLKLAIDSMEPVETDLLLLLGTLRFRLAPRLEDSGIRLNWLVQDLPPLEWIDQRSGLHVLRILQEGFTNIMKHAAASVVTVATRTDGDDVVVTLSDNGRGFDPAAAVAGRGLGNMRRRAAALGGEITLNSGPEGTTLNLRLPVAATG